MQPQGQRVGIGGLCFKRQNLNVLGEASMMVPENARVTVNTGRVMTNTEKTVGPWY